MSSYRYSNHYRHSQLSRVSYRRSYVGRRRSRKYRSHHHSHCRGGHSKKIGILRTWRNMTCGDYGDLGEWFGLQAEKFMHILLGQILAAGSNLKVKHGHLLMRPNRTHAAEIDSMLYNSPTDPPSEITKFVLWLQDPKTTAYIFDVKAIFQIEPGSSKWLNYTNTATTKPKQMERYAAWNRLSGVHTYYMIMSPDVKNHREALMSSTVVNKINWVEETPNLLNLVAHNNTGVGMLYPKTLREMTFV